MSLTDFYHGVETVTVDDGSRPITTVRSSVIFMPYVAPEANDAKFPIGKPMLFNRRSDFAGMGGTTGRRYFDAIFNQTGALVVGLRCAEGESENEQFAAILGGTDPDTGVYSGIYGVRGAQAATGVTPMIFIAPGFTHQRPVGVSAITMTDQGEDYTHATVTFSGGGAIVQATGNAVIEDGKITGIVLDRIGLGYTGAPTITIAGDGTGAAATAAVANAGNPIVGSMLSLADDYRAHILVDGPSTTDAAAFAARGDFGSRRVFMIDPHISMTDTADGLAYVQPSSAAVAGLIARVDNESGFWSSPSNNEIYAVEGLARPIDYAFGSKNSRANILNENQVATIIRDDGYRLWGNRTCSTDPKFAFLSISRTSDIVDISIAMAHKWAVDRGITKTYFDDVSGSVRGYMRTLVKRGAILGGDCWVDPEFNTAADITDGHATFSYDFGGVYPAERLTFRSQLTDKYISTLFS